ncbi:MAG: hypothetical protein U0S12_06665 [Fimbriimonadales bacterium]
MPVAEIRNLSVAYGRFLALNDFSVDIPEGCVGLLGPNAQAKRRFSRPSSGSSIP